MQLALGTGKGWLDEDRPSRGPHRKKRSTSKQRKKQQYQWPYTGQPVLNKQHTPGALGFNPSLLASPPRRAAGKQNSTPLGTDSYSQRTTATTHDDCAIVTDGEG